MGDMADFHMDSYDDFDLDGDLVDEPAIEGYRCGKEELHWQEVNGKWRLFDAESDQHICEPDTSGFERIE